MGNDKVLPGLLDGKQEISAYLHNASDYKMKKYVKMGMPVVIIDGQWIAHKDNLDDWFKSFTRKKVDVIPDD
jgi:hypothetical protein